MATNLENIEAELNRLELEVEARRPSPKVMGGTARKRAILRKIRQAFTPPGARFCERGK